MDMAFLSVTGQNRNLENKALAETKPQDVLVKPQVAKQETSMERILKTMGATNVYDLGPADLDKMRQEQERQLAQNSPMEDVAGTLAFSDSGYAKGGSEVMGTMASIGSGTPANCATSSAVTSTSAAA